MEFTKKDRDFLVKIAKSVETLRKDHDFRLLLLENADGTKAVKQTKINASKKQVDDIIENNNTIQAKFVDDATNDPAKQILIESLYATMKELCEKNGIEKLIIKIDNT
jgi:hypothetical protein